MLAMFSLSYEDKPAVFEGVFNDKQLGVLQSVTMKAGAEYPNDASRFNLSPSSERICLFMNDSCCGDVCFCTRRLIVIDVQQWVTPYSIHKAFCSPHQRT